MDKKTKEVLSELFVLLAGESQCAHFSDIESIVRKDFIEKLKNIAKIIDES